MVLLEILLDSGLVRTLCSAMGRLRAVVDGAGLGSHRWPIRRRCQTMVTKCYINESTKDLKTQCGL